MDSFDLNKIIAKFMGYQVLGIGKFFTIWCPVSEMKVSVGYTQSFDAIFPVWEKMREDKLVFTPSMTCNPLGYYEFEVTPSTKDGDDSKWSDMWGNSSDPVLAAAHATAKAIKELTNEC